MAPTELQTRRDYANCRWYHIAPGRLVVGLMALEGFLLLSERFQWFGFNERKGWTVLIAFASVGAAMVLLLLWFAAALLFRCRFQYSIRSLLLLVVAVAIPCSWLATERRQAKRQAGAVRAIVELGCEANYDYEWDSAKPPPPAWLCRLFGDDFLACLVHVSASAQVTDASLEHLEGLLQLQDLNLSGSQVTNAGLESLERLTQLQQLDLWGTQVTDVGLEHLKGLAQLNYLDLSETQVTDAGIRKLQQALPNCTMRQWTGVAYISAGDITTSAHISSLLDSKGMDHCWWGSIVWGYFVQKHQADAAIRLLREDAKKRGYWIKFYEGNCRETLEGDSRPARGGNRTEPTHK